VSKLITLEHRVLKKNDEIAADNRRLLHERGICALNLVSSPGAGKTSLLEVTLRQLKGRLRVAVIEGDVQTDNDARRIAALDVPVVQMVTNGVCHLDAQMIAESFNRLPLDEVDLLFIENVGNLVCPASYDLGEKMKVVVASTPEGDDKPEKYPAMFHRAKAMVINKIDLLPYVPCKLERLSGNALKINPGLIIFPLSAVTGEGIKQWCDWVLQLTASGRKNELQAQT
jgi:hydrogenase nickel incorporation protein HypB